MPESFCLNRCRAWAGEKLRNVRPSEPANVGGEQRENERSECTFEGSLRLENNPSSRAHH